MNKLIVRLVVAVIGGSPQPPSRSRGQATTEYVLVLVGVAAIALFVVTWATRTGKIGELIDRVFESISSQIS